MTFEGIKVDFPVLKMPQSPEDLASVFRQLNTQFKKALKHYVLDGYVTEYVTIVRDISKAYRYLGLVEKDPERIQDLLERRKGLIELPVNELNPKAYENYWQVLLLKFYSKLLASDS